MNNMPSLRSHINQFTIKTTFIAAGLGLISQLVISAILSICIRPKSFSWILLSPMNLTYRKSVVTTGGVCNSASWLHAKQISLFAKKLYVRSWNQEVCRTSIAYLNLLSRFETNSLRRSRPSWICKEGGSCIKRANVLFGRRPIAPNKWSNSLSTSFSLFACVTTFWKFCCEFEILMSLCVPVVSGEWNTFEIHPIAQNYTVILNQITVTPKFSGTKLIRGYIGIQNHDEESV